MSVEGTCPTIRPMSVETCSIAIAAMDDSKRCVNVGQCREALFTYVVERSTQGHPSPAARLSPPSSGSALRCNFPLRVTRRGGIVDSHHH